MPSSTAGGGPDSQPSPTLQTSAPLQKAPSSQRVSTGSCSIVSVLSSQFATVHATPSSAVGAMPETQPTSLSQLSTPLQNSPSSQLKGEPETQDPAPSQASAEVHASPSEQADAAPSKKQAEEQQSPSAIPPSSQSSPNSIVPFPQTAKRLVTSVRRWTKPLAGFVTKGPWLFINDFSSATVRVGSCSNSRSPRAAA